MTDADYIHAFQQIVMPIGMEFAPDLVISVSSHFSPYPGANDTKYPLVLTLL
jgi:histone deacetylase 6